MDDLSNKRTSIKDAWAKYKQDPEGNKDVLVKCLQDFHDRWKTERKQVYEPGWRSKAAFYAGNQYVRMQRSSNNYRVQLRENHTNATITRILSIVSQNLPIVRVFSNSTSIEDGMNAETTELYGKYYWRKRKLETTFMNWIKHTLIFGSSFLFTDWDQNLGDKLVLNADETESGDKETVDYKGDIKVSVENPFKIVMRPGMEEFDDHYDFIRDVSANRWEMEQKYGEIKADPVSVYNVHTGETRKDVDTILVHHYYHMPTPWFEEGLYACWVGGKLLHARVANESETQLPLVHLPFDKIPLSMYGLSTIDQIMDLQEQLNRAASMIVEARNLVARPRWWAANQLNIPDQMFTDRPGSIMRFDAVPGVPEPKAVVPSFNFTELANHKADVRSAMGMVSGLTGASRGEIPAATKTALALQLVLEMDRSHYLPFINNMHQGLIDVMYNIFAKCAEFIGDDDPRKIKIEGDSAFGRLFHGGLVPSPIDLYLEDTNPLGWTAAGRIEQIGTLIDRGVVSDKNQALEMLDIKSPDPAYKRLNINKQCQAKELELLKKGQRVEIGPEDDDPIHLDVLTEYMASWEFKQQSTPVREACIDHATQHKARLAQAAAPAPGAAPSPAGAIGPGAGAPPMGGAGAVKTAGAQDALSKYAQGQQGPNIAGDIEKLLTSSRG